MPHFLSPEFVYEHLYKYILTHQSILSRPSLGIVNANFNEDFVMHGPFSSRKPFKNQNTFLESLTRHPIAASILKLLLNSLAC